MKFVILISLIISEHAIWADLHYKEVYLSKSCDAYAPHSHSLSEIEGKSMVIVKAYDSSDGCEVIQFNCSIVIRPAPGQALLASPLNISVDHEVGAVRVSLDGWPTWLLDDSNKHNFLPKTEVTHVDGSVQIDFIMMRPASTWRHANFSLLLTSFLPKKEGPCPRPFYFDCGNFRCIRQSLRCDGKDNCGNILDETDCGMTATALATLIILCIVCFIFFMSVLVIASKPGLVRNLTKKNPKIVVKEFE